MRYYLIEVMASRGWLFIDTLSPSEYQQAKAIILEELFSGDEENVVNSMNALHFMRSCDSLDLINQRIEKMVYRKDSASYPLRKLKESCNF